MADLKQQFEQAAADVKKLSERPDNDTMLRLYALYKQGSEGDVKGDRPGFLDLVHPQSSVLSPQSCQRRRG